MQKHGTLIISDEKVMELLEAMTEVTRMVAGDLDIIRGIHPDHGVISLLSGVTSTSILLYPFENQEHFSYSMS